MWYVMRVVISSPRVHKTPNCMDRVLETGVAPAPSLSTPFGFGCHKCLVRTYELPHSESGFGGVEELA